ncbi:MAG: 5'/3'-nucleotidase SurE [Christensenellales bacterium]
MHLLLSNDDGIFASGLHSLARAAIQRGHQVTICAPATQQSATSHRLTITNSLMAREYAFEGAKAYAVDGSPVDCVRVGRYLAQGPIDFCLAGINDGENIGSALYYSGTAGAAREAAMLNLPAIAVSIGQHASEDMRLHLANVALDLMMQLKDQPLPRLTFCNINAKALPSGDLKPLVLAPISDSFYLDHYIKRINPRGVPYFWIEAGDAMEPAKPGTDVALYQTGHITCTFVGGFSDRNDQFQHIVQ